ncbi:DUF4097 domain-containing protein [Streptomyces sp. NPDC015131]|uniref:DUF4097 family beta strand repeat-containing protein n=1 Tax=Streptomyces sp. NPDC015131 TaxID=3364941 RepID=UPI0036F8A6EB
MPTFDTPEPITVTLEFDVGTVRITAGERTDTVVDVRPSDGTEENDVKAAEQTRVTCANGRLDIKGPRKRSVFGRSGSIEVTVALPAGSHLEGNAPAADFHCEGVFGKCRVKTSAGDIRIEEAASVNLRTGHGDIRVDRVDGPAEIAGAGRVDLGEITGAATVKNGNGETVVGEITGELRANASNGRISVGVARAGVDAKAANGAIRIGEAVRGRVVLQSAAGDLEIGIREDTAAWLDVHTRFGNVQNDLGPAGGPGDAAETVEVRARTGIGDIVIRRP